MSHWPTLYTDLNAVLHELVGRVKNDLSDNFIGAYLQGSFAIGDFDTHSDVDFIVITAADISDSQLSALQEVHGDIFDLSSPWAQHLEGSYIPKDALGQFPPSPRLFYYLDNGQQELIRSDHDDCLVVYWVLREKESRWRARSRAA
jgi:Nucleotidyltransferase domain